MFWIYNILLKATAADIVAALEQKTILGPSKIEMNQNKNEERQGQIAAVMNNFSNPSPKQQCIKKKIKKNGMPVQRDNGQRSCF